MNAFLARSIVAVGVLGVIELVAPASGVAVELPQEVAARLQSWEREAPPRVTEMVARLRSDDPGDMIDAAGQIKALGTEARGAIAALIDAYVFSKTAERPANAGRLWVAEVRRLPNKVREALQAIGPEAVPPLVAAAETDQLLTPLLAEMRAPNAVQQLAAAIDSTVPQVRSAAVRALGRTNDQAVAALSSALLSPTLRVESVAAQSLAQLGTPRAAASLIAAIRKGGTAAPPARRALGSISAPSAVPVLIALLNDQDDRLAATAIEAVVRSGNRDEVTLLVDMLVIGSPAIVDSTHRALAKFDRDWASWPSARAIAPELLRVYRSRDGIDQKNVFAVMLDIADPTFAGAFLEKLWDNPESVAAIAPALARIGDPRAVPVLLGALEHTNRATARQRVITAAGQLGGPRALSFLLSLTEPQTTEAADRQTAIAVLAVHGDDAAVGRLMGIVGADEQDGYDRRDVSIALEALGNTKIANPDQLHAAQALLLEISAGDHWIERQADGTRSTGQFTRQANRALRNLNAGNAD